jgi:hypothetical protein
MAKYNEILVGRYNRFIQKLLSMKGPASMPQLASELQTVLPVFNGVENRNLEGWDRFGCAMDSGTALAGNNVALQLRNPAGSNVVAVLEKVLLSTKIAESGMTVSLGVMVGLLNGIAQVNGRLDPRGRAAATLATTGSLNSGAAPLTAIMFLDTLALTPLDLVHFEDHEITILPGDGFQLTSAAALQRFLAGVVWRERFLEDSERA